MEEVPQDQLVVRSNEYLVPIAHFDKDPGRMFGVPFFLKVRSPVVVHEVVLSSIHTLWQHSEMMVETFRYPTMNFCRAFESVFKRG